jgi:hypothetical protein
MADLKISQLTGATTPLAGTEVLPVVQSGSTKKVTVANLTAGRAIAVATLTNSTGVFNNVGTAQTVTIASGQAGVIVITGVQGGVGASAWNVPFVNRLGTTAVSASPTKAIVTADPISTVTASGADIVITPLAANTYISYAIYYTPCAV